jgi:hypothetical protein
MANADKEKQLALLDGVVVIANMNVPRRCDVLAI